MKAMLILTSLFILITNLIPTPHTTSGVHITHVYTYDTTPVVQYVVGKDTFKGNRSPAIVSINE